MYIIFIYTSFFPSKGSDDYIPEALLDVTFAPQDVSPICLDTKDDVHGLGYRGLNPSLALPGSHVSMFDPPAAKSRPTKGIRGQVIENHIFTEYFHFD